jgi:hypothetical protein
VHLAIQAGERSILMQDGRGVVVEAGGAALEEGSDDDDLLFAGDGAQALSAGAGDGLGYIKQSDVFALAEVLKSSGRQTISAPSRAASRTRSAALSRLASGSGPHDIWIRPTR